MDNKYTDDNPDEDFSEPYGTIEPCTDEHCPCHEDDDPDATEWDLADTARRVKFIPAPEDDSEWYSEDCPPDCKSCSD